MPERELWQEVLLRTIADARLDPSSWPIPESAFEETAEGRKYLTTPSKDLATVCSLAGVEVDALLERMQKRVAEVPAVHPVKGKQARNRGRCIEHDGRSLPIKRWSEITGISTGVISDRLRKGWSVVDALTVPTSEGIRHAKKKSSPTITYEGETLTYREWAERTGLVWFVIRDRMANDWPVEEVLRPGDRRGARLSVDAVLKHR